MDSLLESKIINELKTVYDPEIPVNVYDLGLIYNLKEKDGVLDVEMTLTAPGCPIADEILAEVKMKLECVTGIHQVNINLVFEPAWNQDMMSEEAKMDLGFL